MKTHYLASLVVTGVLLVSSLTAHGDDLFSFSGYTFNQLNTPDQGVLLGMNAVLGGATFSAGLPNHATSPIRFPQGLGGFNTAGTLGRLTGLSVSGGRAVNLPYGDNGVSTRHGIEVWWTKSALPNLNGPDFVIYESGTSNAVEGVMARAHVYAQDWTGWYYFAPLNHQETGGGVGRHEVLFAYPFDLSRLGVATNASIDRIQLANLTQADRIATTNVTDVGAGIVVGQGRVVFDNSSDVHPDAGPFNETRQFSAQQFDPDPLYVAALHDVHEVVPATVAGNRSFKSDDRQIVSAEK